MSNTAYIVAGYRTAVGKAPRGGFRFTRPDEVADLARRSTPEQNIRRIDAIFTAREQMMEFNTTPLLALESMMVELRIG